MHERPEAGSRGSPRLAVCLGDELADAVATELAVAGARACPEVLPDQPWARHGDRLWSRRTVSSTEDLCEVADLLARGITVVASAEDEQLAAALFEQGGRLARSEWFDRESPPLTLGLARIHLSLLLRLQRGDDVASAARACHVSPRTAARRLAEARNRLHARTTAEAAARVAARIHELTG